MPTYTMADFAKVAKSELEKAVITTWRETSMPMELLPWKQKSALEIKFKRTQTLVDVPWRDFNDTFVHNQVDFDEVTERIHFLGNKIDIPKALVLADSFIDQRKTQEQAIVKSMARSFNHAFINGNPVTDTKQLVGLWYRLKNALASGQTVLGGSLDISVDTATTTWAGQFFDKIEELRYTCEGGDCDVLIMNRTVKMRLEAAMRVSGLKSTTEDKTGKRYPSYGEGGPRIVDIGYKYDDSTMIMGNVEAADGTALTGGACSSIYAVKFGEPYLAGFYEYPINVDDVGLLEDRINYRTVVEWSPGIYHVHPRAIARLVGLVAA